MSNSLPSLARLPIPDDASGNNISPATERQRESASSRPVMAPGKCYIWTMMQPAVRTQVRQFLRAAAAIACCLLQTAYAQEPPERDADSAESMDEIVVVVDRDGKPVDIDALRLEEAMLEVIQEFELEQHKQEEELWRQRLRSVMQQKTSRIAWGYDAQSEAAEFRYAQANYLPIDRVTPATLVSIRF